MGFSKSALSGSSDTAGSGSSETGGSEAETAGREDETGGSEDGTGGLSEGFELLQATALQATRPAIRNLRTSKVLPTTPVVLCRQLSSSYDPRFR